MAEVTPFKGILYNPDRIGDMAAVATPPYDVISKKQQAAYYERHPKNIIRLILNRPEAGDVAPGDDGPGPAGAENPHVRAARFYKQWLAEGVLIREPGPALYLTRTDFDAGGRRAGRYGLIAAVRLEPFEKGIVLPHERTFSRIKSERLSLMRHCHANFSPIFSVYPDTDNMLGRLMDAVDAVDAAAPQMDFVDDAGHRQALWRIADPAVHAEVTAAMADKTIFIADGHHRYETALVYRDWVARRTAGFDERHPANGVMMCLSSMEDPGLVILPAHRMLRRIDADMRRRMLSEAKRYFAVRRIPVDPAAPAAAMGALAHGLDEGAMEHTIGIHMVDDPSFYLLGLKPGAMAREFAGELDPALLDLDVTVLTQLVMTRILGFGPSDLDDESRISYASRIPEAVAGVAEGECDVAFLINPTRIDQVRRIAEKGLIMPRKSTYFYPKVITGQVLRSLSD